MATRERVRGARNGRARLREYDIRTIRELLASGIKQADIAKIYCVSQAQISRIKHRKKWGHVGGYVPTSTAPPVTSGLSASIG